jgi:hypothetical protein
LKKVRKNIDTTCFAFLRGFLYNQFMMNKLPIGISTLTKLLEENYIYVDKTKLLAALVLNSSQYCFLSRPRRFGKSLLVSTLKEIFSGNQAVFKGLWIEKNRLEKISGNSYGFFRPDLCWKNGIESYSGLFG